MQRLQQESLPRGNIIRARNNMIRESREFRILYVGLLPRGPMFRSPVNAWSCVLVLSRPDLSSQPSLVHTPAVDLGRYPLPRE